MSSDEPLTASDLALLRFSEESLRLEPSERLIAARFGSLLAQVETTTVDFWMNVAVPVEAEDDPLALAGSIEEARRFFHAHERAPRFEFSDRRWPRLPAALEQAGLRLEEREPLLFCEPDALRGVSAPGVSFHILTPEDPDETLGAHQKIRFDDQLEGKPPYAPEWVIARLRRQVAEGQREYVLAYLGSQIAGTGVSVTLPNGGAEIVGIATQPALRRRGVAASVTTFLTQRLYARGARLVWLTAAQPAAQRIYERLGFRRIGDWLTYTEADE
jgi:ribosomal protein S18 acetylase RimI-like enzyme